MSLNETKIKIFIAAVDPNVDSYLEEVIERWRVSSIYARELLRTETSISSKDIVMVIIYRELQRRPEEVQKHFNYLRENSKKIFGRKLDNEEFSTMGFMIDGSHS